MTRTDKVIRGITATTVVLLGVAAAVVSFRHAYAVSLDNGQDPLTSVLTPVTIDLPILAASMVLLDSARRGARRPFLAVLTLLLGITATIGINGVYGAAHGLLGGLVAAWPAVALTLSVELLMGMIRRAARTAVPAAGSKPVPEAQVQPSTPSGTPPDTTVQTVAEESLAAPEIRHAGADSATVPVVQVRAPGPVPVAEIRRLETDLGDARRADGSDLRQSGDIWSELDRTSFAPVTLTDAETLADSAEGDANASPAGRVRAPEPYLTEEDPAGSTNVEIDAVPADEGRVPEAYPEADPHQVQAAAEFAEELAEGAVPSVRRIKSALRVGQPKAEQVRDYLRRLVDAQPADGERVGADAG